MILLVLCSFVLFLFRYKWRIYYAALEISFGCVVGWNGFNILDTDGFGKWPVVLGAAYILVRGFDNFKVGLQEHKSELQLRGETQLKVENPLVSEKSINPMDTIKSTSPSSDVGPLNGC